MEENFKVCHTCGQKNQMTSRFCANCGSDLDKRYCPNCGIEVNEEIFCTQCGTRLIEDGVRVDATTAKNNNTESTIAHTSNVKNGISSATLPKKELKKIIVNSFVFIVCLVCFILSFLSILSFDLDEISDGALSGTVNVNSVDIIDLGINAMKSEKQGSRDIVKEERIVKEASREFLNYTLKGKGDSDKAIACAKTATIGSLRVILMQEDSDGTSTEATFMTAGILSIAYIIVTFIFAFISAWMLFDSVIQLLKASGKEFAWYKKSPRSINIIPYLAIVLGLVLALMGVMGNVSSGSVTYGYAPCIIAVIILTALLLIAYTAFCFKKSKKYVFSVIVLIMVACAIGCSFAPILTIDIEYDDGSVIYERKTPLGVDFLSSFLFTEEQEKEMLDPTTVDEKKAIFQGYITAITNNYEGEEFEYGDADGQITELMKYLVTARDTKAASEAFSIAYFLMIAFYVLAGVVISLLIANLKSEAKKLEAVSLSLVAIMLVVTLVVLAVSIVIGVLAGMNVDIYQWYTYVSNINITAGIVFTLIFTILTLVFNSVLIRIGRKNSK